MLKVFAELASGKGATKAQESRDSSSRTLPTAAHRLRQINSSSGDSWMARWDVRQDPVAFFRTVYENVFPIGETPLRGHLSFHRSIFKLHGSQQEQDRALSLLIQKRPRLFPRVSGAKIQSRLVLIFNTEGEVTQELNVQAPFARSVLLPAPSVEEREDFFRFAAGQFYSADASDRFDPSRDTEHLRLVATQPTASRCMICSVWQIEPTREIRSGPQAV